MINGLRFVAVVCGGNINVRVSVIVMLFSLVFASLQPPLIHETAATPAFNAISGIAPQITANAAIAVDLTSGQELYAHNPDVPLPPASTVKIMTALVASRILDRNEVITITEADILPEEFSAVGLLPGDQASVHDLLYGVLLPSGGDASLALARIAGDRLEPGTPDPVGRFVGEMNNAALALGMTGSHFSDPVGFDNEMTKMTARDLVRASEAVLSDWLLSHIVATPWAVVRAEGPNAREIIIENSNHYVLYGEGSIGIKTGTTELSGECLVNAVKRGENTIITVVLGSQFRYDDTNAILGAVDGAVTWLQFGGNSESDGARDYLAAEGLRMPVSRTVAVPSSSVSSLDWNYNETVAVDGKRGRVSFTISGQSIAVLPVYEIN